MAVTAVPDPQKGRTADRLSPADREDARRAGQRAGPRGLPNLWIPSTDSFFEVDQIPLLGTGKLDLQAVKELANERVSATA